MDTITVTLKTIVRFFLAVALLDLALFIIPIVPTLDFGGQFLVPSSWSLDYFASPVSGKIVFREIALMGLAAAAICIYGWAMSLITENV